MSNIIKFPDRRPSVPVVFAEGDTVHDFTDETRFYVAGELDLILLPHHKHEGMTPGISFLLGVRDCESIEGYYRQFKGSEHLSRFIQKLQRVRRHMKKYEESIS